jgi:hypothetical protein
MCNWKRMVTDFGWALAMTDPTCYSYYLASRLDSPNGKGAPNIVPPRMALSSLRDRDRARPTVLRSTSDGS